MAISTAQRDYLLGVRDGFRNGLLKDTLPFWLTHAVDAEYGGYLTCLAADGTVVDTDKGIWQQGRFAWLLAHLYAYVEPVADWIDVASSGIDFLDRAGFDPGDGRMWFHVAQDGSPVRKRRYAFSESFASIAYAQFAMATGRGEYVGKAIDCFEAFVRHHQNPPRELAKFEPGRVTRSLSFPMITLVTAQSLRATIDYQWAEQWIEWSIEAIQKWHIKEDLNAVLETVGPEGQVLPHFDGRTLNPGHAIEGAWFILHEAHHRQDARLLEIGCSMLRMMWQRGWDQKFGGILYFVDLAGGDVQEYWHDMKFWWPHNETIIATLIAFLLTEDDWYFEAFRQVLEWSDAHFPDKEHGEWFGYLHRDGTVSSRLKGNLWKGPFHLPRMQLVCWQWIDRFLGSQ